MSEKVKLKKNDFVEIEFIGKIKNTGEIFDTNIPKEAKKINSKLEAKPFVLCIGQNMILPAIDEFLEGKELGEYSLELLPEKAFGTRKRDLIKTVSINQFKQQNINPYPGMVFNFDNIIGRISAVSGGRVIIDFNNPLSGKALIYELKLIRKIEDLNEKINSLIKAFLRKDFEFEVQEKKLIIKSEKSFKQFIELFKEPFKQILDLDLQVQETEKKQKEKPEIKKEIEKDKKET